MTIPLSTTDQLLEAKDYKNLIVIYRNGSPVRLSDLGTVTDSVEDVRNIGLADGKPAVLMIISRQPGRQHYRHGGPGEGADAAVRGFAAADDSSFGG